MNKKFRLIRNLTIISLMIVFQLSNPMTSYAMNIGITPYAYDVDTRTCSNTENYSKTMISINPTVAAVNIPSNVATVNFSISAVAYMRYNRVTGLYSSTSSPTITLNYSGPVALTIQSSSTSYRDNGSSITYMYSGNIVGTIVSDNGVYCTIDYGTFSGAYTVNK